MNKIIISILAMGLLTGCNGFVRAGYQIEAGWESSQELNREV